jgi:hypothetical protein
MKGHPRPDITLERRACVGAEQRYKRGSAQGRYMGAPTSLPQMYLTAASDAHLGGACERHAWHVYDWPRSTDPPPEGPCLEGPILFVLRRHSHDNPRGIRDRHDIIQTDGSRAHGPRCLAAEMRMPCRRCRHPVRLASSMTAPSEGLVVEGVFITAACNTFSGCLAWSEAPVSVHGVACPPPSLRRHS